MSTYGEVPQSAKHSRSEPALTPSAEGARFGTHPPKKGKGLNRKKNFPILVFAVLERLLSKDQEQVSPEVLVQLSLGELLITHLLGGIAREHVPFAQQLFVQLIEEGERHLAELYKRFVNDFFGCSNGAGKPTVRAFTDYHEYLRFIYAERPAALVDPLIARLPPERADYVRFYKDMLNPVQFRKGKRASPDPFTVFTRTLQFYGEAAYSSNPGRRVALVVCRRKDTERAIEKTAYRLLEAQIEQAHAQRSGKTFEPRPLAVTDWFGIKLVTYHPEQVHPLFREMYPNLERYGLEPDAHQEQRRNKEGHWIAGYQECGVDDHRFYGAGKDKLIQLKVCPQRVPGQVVYHRLREIAFTDVPNMLVDEMEHVRFRQRQAKKLDNLCGKKREYKRRYREFIARGEELHALLPTERRRILTPGQYFN